jgi:hypothetical protein
MTEEAKYYWKYLWPRLRDLRKMVHLSDHQAAALAALLVECVEYGVQLDENRIPRSSKDFGTFEIQEVAEACDCDFWTREDVEEKKFAHRKQCFMQKVEDFTIYLQDIGYEGTPARDNNAWRHQRWFFHQFLVEGLKWPLDPDTNQPKTGWTVHCTCDYPDRYNAWVSKNGHFASRCGASRPFLFYRPLDLFVFDRIDDILPERGEVDLLMARGRWTQRTILGDYIFMMNRKLTDEEFDSVMDNCRYALRRYRADTSRGTSGSDDTTSERS